METSFDFDYLCTLYKTDPEEFEAIRKKIIDDAIKSARESSQRRLRGIQFQVDAKRRIHKNTPYVACMEVSKMMHQSFDELRFRLNGALKQENTTQKAPEPKQQRSVESSENVVVSINTEAKLN